VKGGGRGGAYSVGSLRLALSKGPHRVGVTPSSPFYLKMEAEPVSETFLKKKHWMMDKVLKQDYSKYSKLFRID
jgi:hypothetical protein